MFTTSGFDRIPESSLVMDSAGAVDAFFRAGEPNGILSGMYAYQQAQSSRMIVPGSRVLDLGCGPANLLTRIAASHPESSFVGVDLSEGMLESGRTMSRSLGVNNLELRNDDMTSLDSVADKTVDVVLSSMALHHLKDPTALAACFASVERVLTPNGRIFISDFGRLKSPKSVEYFVNRAIAGRDPILEHDYRESLRAAFSKPEFAAAIPTKLRKQVRVRSTIVSPIIIVIMSQFPQRGAGDNLSAHVQEILGALPRERLSDFRQLRLFLRLGGVPWTD